MTGFTRYLCLLQLVAIVCATCPCPNCPSGSNYVGACCHGNRTCETQNWSPTTCTPAYGTWCPWKPAGRCGFSCGAGCDKCASYSSSPFCQSNETHCTGDCKGKWCPLAPVGNDVSTVNYSDACTGASASLDAAECAAWQKFYDSAKGSGWYTCATNRNDPCGCKWAEGQNSVTCSADGAHINYIIVSNVQGALDDSALSAFTQLTHLEAGGGLVDPQLLPPSIKGLSKLTYLNFNNIKGLGGGLTDDLIRGVPNLTYLQLNAEMFNGTVPIAIASLAKLTTLKLEGNAFTGPLPKLPFAQYTAACDLSGNDFACPLPAGAAQHCKATCK